MKTLSVGAVTAWFLLFACTAPPGAAQPTPATVRVDFRHSQGPFVRMSGVQGSPLPMTAEDTDHTLAFRKYRLELCRFPQDCEPNTLTLAGTFPNAQGDPDNPKAYRFSAIDSHILAARQAGCQVLWQASYDLGSSDHWQGLNLGGRAPQDMTRWCRVVTRCLEHFNNGWSHGHQHTVHYVEFVNEPDGLGGFTGPERKRLAPCFVQFLRTIQEYNRAHPDTPVEAVGPGVPLSWDRWPKVQQPTERLLSLLVQEGVTLPIFSFHTYGDDTSPGANQKLARAFRQALDAHGMKSTRLWNSEWQATDHLRQMLGGRRPAVPAQEIGPLYQRAVAAYALACKIRWQGLLDACCYYLAVRRCYPPTHQAPRLDLGIFFPPRSAPNLLAEQERRLAEWTDRQSQRVSTVVTPNDGEVSALGLRSSRGLGVLVSNPSTTPRKLLIVMQLQQPAQTLHLQCQRLGGPTDRVVARGQGVEWQWDGQLPAVTSLFVQLEPGPK